jgi:hypothetical protein
MDNTVRSFQVLSLTTSLVLSGANFGASTLTLPILYSRPPSVSTPIFEELYTRGGVALVPLGIFSASCSAIVAYSIPTQRTLWGAAALATIGQLPWTVLIMMPGIKKLNAVAESSKEAQEKADKEEVTGLLKEWAWMNIVRGGFAFVGGLVGIWALIDSK